MLLADKLHLHINSIMNQHNAHFTHPIGAQHHGLGKFCLSSPYPFTGGDS